MEMEKILRKMPAGGEGHGEHQGAGLNPNHAVFGALKAAHEAGDTDKINKYAELLYDQALLIEGLPLERPRCLRTAGLRLDEVMAARLYARQSKATPHNSRLTA